MTLRTANPNNLSERLAGVRLLSTDVDGVLTDGGLYVTEKGEVSRKFNAKDGMGLQRVMAAGIEVCVISAGTTASTAHRMRRLGVTRVHLGVEDKLAVLAAVAAEIGCPMERVAHIGDDLNDLALMGAVGVPLSVADAMAEVKAQALYVTGLAGGQGAVREICELLAAARAGVGGGGK